MALDRTVDITLRRLLCIRIAFIEILLTSGQADLELDFPVTEIAFRRNQGQTILLHGRVQPDDLTLMHEEFSRPHRVQIIAVPVIIRADMHTDQEHLPFFDLYITVLEIDSAGAK